MFLIVGLAIVFGAVFGGYIAAGGKMAPIIKAAPIETFIIVGSALGASLVGNSLPTFIAALMAPLKVLSGPKWKPADYLGLMVLIGKLLAVMKREGVVALEAHVETPDSSPIFSEFPKIAKDHGIVDLICNTLRLVVISQGQVDADAVDDMMAKAIKTHHHDAMRAPAALLAISGSLPALGIVACVLGVVKTMGAIDQPPPVLGALIGGALVGTFLGVFFSYGIFEPMGNRLGQIIDEEGQMLDVVRAMLVANLKGHPPALMIEAGRAAISHANQPGFSDVFDAIRG
ncbi:MAG: flagellar motor stator protein MotA [Betaproteobacteria bacterium]|nr:flagellar motor stator protein MotA [Betaproteobacteria bacterium]NBT75900.1 flagellar motor stator protein MotA [Betaproteobacteria bacterium]NBY14489.1 flagellar motor stator protein MotA [Betaproteobacteria bacterium]NCA16405.1 flagellar motor stator protein MotA [Betaproteobacteria bacterium]